MEIRVLLHNERLEIDLRGATAATTTNYVYGATATRESEAGQVEGGELVTRVGAIERKKKGCQRLGERGWDAIKGIFTSFPNLFSGGGSTAPSCVPTLRCDAVRSCAKPAEPRPFVTQRAQPSQPKPSVARKRSSPQPILHLFYDVATQAQSYLAVSTHTVDHGRLVPNQPRRATATVCVHGGASELGRFVSLCFFPSPRPARPTSITSYYCMWPAAHISDLSGKIEELWGGEAWERRIE